MKPASSLANSRSLRVRSSNTWEQTAQSQCRGDELLRQMLERGAEMGDCGFAKDMNEDGDGAKRADRQERQTNGAALARSKLSSDEQADAGAKHAAGGADDREFGDSDQSLTHGTSTGWV